MESADVGEPDQTTSGRPTLAWFRTPAYDDLLHAFTGRIPEWGKVRALCGHSPYADELQGPQTGPWAICVPCQEAADPQVAVRRVRAEFHAEHADFRPLVGESSPFEPSGGWVRPTHLPLTGFRDEADLTERVLNRLAPWFTVSRQVSGAYCDGDRRLRIDAVVHSKPVCPPTRDVTFAIEFKRPDPQQSLHYYTGWVAQAIDYTHVDWDGFGRLMVFACPPVLDNFDRMGSVDVLERVMGQLGVGQLGLFAGHGLTFVLNGHRIWSERDGFMRTNWSLKRKTGNR